MKPKSKLLSLLLTICLVVGLMPTAAFAAGTDTGKAIQLVDSGTAANIGGGQADNIYFGTYQQSSDGNSGYNIDPIKWRVLENANGQLFLLSDQNLDVFQYHVDYESVTWETSTMRSWLNGYGASENTGGDNGTDYTSDNFIGAAFSEKEQKAIAETTVVNDDNPYYNTDGGNDTTDQIFLLSIEEALNTNYGFNSNYSTTDADSGRVALNTAYAKEQGAYTYISTGAGDWWLRSPGYGDIDAAIVDYDGYLIRYGSIVDRSDAGVRPAFNLNLNSVLFTSAAEGGKSATGMGSGLTAVDGYDGNEWKLTLLDEARNSFEISNATITDTITFSYSGAATGTNEYISAVVVDNGAITHYGRILQPRSTSGTASFTIPDGVTLSDTTKLYVFNEQYNSDKMTDYASQLKEISSSTVDTTAPTLTAGDATRDSETTATVKFTSSEAGSYYYEVVNSGENQPTIDTDGTGTTCGTTEQTISLTNLSDTSAKDIYIVVKDAAANVSQPLKITIPAYIAPSYGISASPAALNFGSKTVDYTEAPVAQTVTLTNTGNQNVTVDLPTSTNYIITAGEGFTNDTATLAPNGTAAFTVQPKTGLGASDYSETLTISGSNGTSANVQLSFTVAFATGSDKAIMLGTSGISDPTSTQNSSGTHYTPSDYVYFGVKGSDPIKWRVLDADKTNDGTTSGMFLLSEYLLDNDVVFERVWNSDDNDGQSNPNEWQHSDAQNWCSTFATNSDVFSTAEQAAFLSVTKTDNSEGSLYSSGWGTSSLTENDKVFFLSVRELADYVGNYDKAPGLCATDTAQSAGWWWLRSPSASNTGYAGLVSNVGIVYSYTVLSVWAARPAFNLNLNSVLFTSAAVGGKSSGTVDADVLQSVSEYTGNEWKLTLLDETREFAVTEQTVSGKPGDTITLNYTGATTGENEYISVIIADENGAQYYGRVAQPGGESGTATLSIPADLAPGSYTLNVFSEQYNGDYKTDYASAFAEVALTVEEAAAPGIDTGKAIQLVDSGTAANIGGGQADNIYFGTYQQSSDGNSGYNTDPIKWRVLSMNGNSGTYSDGTETVDANNAMFLLSDGLLGTGNYGGVYFDNTSPYSNAWQGSDAQAWCRTFYSNNLTTQEQGAVLATTKSDRVFTSNNNIQFAASNNILNGDKVFFLSAEEAETGDYGFGSDNDRKANYGSSAGCWWLRSPYAYITYIAGLVDTIGYVGSIHVNSDWAARPAFNVNLKSVLFTSAAAGGKSAAVGADAIFKIGDYDGNEWKLTLLDEAHKNFEISNATITDSDDTIDFSYSGAATGTNEYISAVVVDNGAITHYGRILQIDGTTNGTSGTASFTIPDGVTLSDTVKLYVFNEQYNGDKMTDYASQLKEISRPTVDTTAPTLTAGDATRTGETTATVKFTSDEAGSYYYVVDNNATAPVSIDTTTAGASCNANEETTITLDNLSGEYIHIVVKDAEGNESQPLTIQIPAYTSTTFTVTVNVDPSEGGTASADPSAAAEGTEITLTATPSTGYHFKEWQVTEGTASIGDDNKFTMPAENVTVKAVFEAHSFTQENTDSEYLASSATCTQAATYYYSCSCGAKDTNNTFTSGEALGHTLGADWKYNDSNHWKECEDCGAKVDEAAHVYTDDADTTCNDCGYVKPTYAISASPETLDFGSKAEGYAAAPDAQEVTITNTGKQSVTVNLPTSTNYIITAGEGFTDDTATLAPNGTATFTVQPKTGLGAGDYSETLTVSGGNNVSASIELSFTVLETYTLTVDLNGGSGSTIGGEYTAGEVVNIDAGSRSNYRFDGWTSSNGGSFADASSASTTFIMPAADTTITAAWSYIGGGGSTTDYYRLTFETNGGSEISSIRRAEYTTIDLTDYTPTREGYEFTGWYADEDLTEKITSIRLIRNTTVYAGWEEIKDNPFTDVSESDWFYEDVMFVFANGLMIGTSDTTFSPEISTSRAMIAVTLWRMEGEPAVKGANPFTDVENGAWYTEAITWANENGIAEGYGNGCFQPETPVTREQLASFFYRYAEYKGYDITITGSLDRFNDKNNVSEWAKDTMAWAVGYGLIGGKGNNMLDSQGEATRAEFAAMLQRFCQKG